jgi:hypothetical protein
MKKLLVLFLILPFTKLYAQDSLSYQKNGYTNYLETLLEINNQNLTNYYHLPIHNFTSSNLSVSATDNSIKQKKQMGTGLDVELAAQGVYRLNKTLFTGKIGYIKSYPKEIGWNSSQMMNQTEVEKSPFYYFSYQQGDWNNQLYQLSGTLTTPILNEKLYVSLGIDYKTQQYFRTDDPMPKLNYLDLLTEFGLQYHLSKSNKIGLNFSWGYTDNEIDIKYTDASLNVPHYEDLYNRVSLGYGLFSSAQYKDGKEEQKHLGGAITYTIYKNRNQYNFKLITNSHKTDFTEVYTSDNASYKIGHYDVMSYQLLLSYLNQTSKKYCTLDIQYQNGNNYRTATVGKNYEASSLFTAAEYGLLKEKNGKVNYEMALFTQFNYLKKQDYSVLNMIEYSNVKVGGKISKIFHLKGNKKIWWKNESAYQFKISKKSSFANTADKFVKEIAAPELIYNTSSQITFNNRIAYQSNIKEFKINIGVFANTNSFLSLSEEAKSYFGGSKGINSHVGLFLNLVY